MNPRVLFQSLGDLSQLLFGVQGEVDKDPFPAAKLARSAPASAEPFVPDLISELSRNFTTLLE